MRSLRERPHINSCMFQVLLGIHDIAKVAIEPNHNMTVKWYVVLLVVKHCTQSPWKSTLIHVGVHGVGLCGIPLHTVQWYPLQASIGRIGSVA